MGERNKAKSPYQKYGKTPYRYSELSGIAHQRMLIRTFGANYWIKVDANGKPFTDQNGKSIRMFGHEAYQAA